MLRMKPKGKNGEIQAVFFSYTQALRSEKVRACSREFAIEEYSNIRLEYLGPGSEVFETILAESFPVKFAGMKHGFVLQTLTEKELLMFHYLSNRIAPWKEFYDNYSISGESFYEKQNKAKYYFRCFVQYLRLKKPVFVLFNIIPHLGLDYLFYLAAQRCDIPIAMFHCPLNPRAFLVLDSIERLGSLNGLPDYPMAKYEIDPVQENKVWWYMKPVKPPTPLKRLRQFVVSVLRNLNPRKTRQGLETVYRRCRKKIGFLLFAENNTKAIRRGTRDFNAIVPQPFDLSKFKNPFVLFPLHLNYELTTAPLGGEFVDQLDALSFIRDMVPDDVTIVVKENPKQKYHMRDRWFFARIEQLPNVCYIQGGPPMSELIRRSEFVASVLGTVGWEAVSQGKPALVFGNAWYSSIPGVFHVNNGVKYDQIKNSVVDVDAVEVARKQLSKKLIPGMVSPPGYIKSQMTAEDVLKNKRRVAKGLCWFMNTFYGIDAIKYYSNGDDK